MCSTEQRSDLLKSKIFDPSSLRSPPSVEGRHGPAITPDGVTYLLFAPNTKKNSSDVERDRTAEDIEYSTTTTSCTSSTDSGVNVGDNDEISQPPPSSEHLNSFNSSLSAIEADAAANACQTKSLKSIENTKRCNNTEFGRDNSCKIVHNNTKDCISKDDIYEDHDFDDKFEALLSGGNISNNILYQLNRSVLESGIALNMNQQENLATLDSSDKESLQCTAFANLEQPTAVQSPSPTPSVSSASNCGDGKASPKQAPYGGSPNVSIRSISSTIITSDSDSDLISDSDDNHENYVIKKLGTQVTYSPGDANIPHINNGHTVLNQKVVLDDNQAPHEPLAALAAIGDRIGAAQVLGPGSSLSSVPQRQQIGSIAVSNSSDVTFGDKHFYEGPVTIQQFLIDGHDKWKETNGKDNPTVANESADTCTNSAKEKSSKLYEYVWQRKKVLILAVLTFMALLIAASVLASKMLNDSKNTNANDDDDDLKCREENATLCFIDRDVWRGHSQKGDLDEQTLPLHRVVISHTASEACDSIKVCSYTVRVIQAFHMHSLGWDDIGYNFLISSDGRIYVGRGWDFVGAHTKGYNYDSVGISFIGTYISVAPAEIQLEACQKLLKEGLRLKKLDPNYRLYAEDNIGGGYVLRMVTRPGWLAQPPVNPLVPLNLPVARVIVIPTRTSECETQAACTYTVRITQTYNIESQQQDDIIYNFLIGGDGNVYEGRGWDNRGSVVKGFNDDSISVAFIGSFKKQPPSYKQLNVTDLLLTEGVRLKKLSRDYKIVGANQLDPTSVTTIADALYKSFENWPHWSSE